ncbi:MAG: DedA family protein [Burkholderiales bacterium]|nr:DedA family protein [Burkholderiales bacterium]
MLDALQSWFTAEASLWALLGGSFVAATLVPISSEVMLLAVLRAHPEQLWPALGVATLGNSAGGMVSYALGRLVPHRRAVRHEAWLVRHGAPALLLAWLPVAGDALCVAAGWLRLPWPACLLFMAAGRALRYGAVAALAL